MSIADIIFSMQKVEMKSGVKGIYVMEICLKL